MQNVYLVQMESIPNDKKHNLAHARELLNATSVEQGSLILFPEMFATGYVPQDPAEFAEDFSHCGVGETAKFLSTLANETKCTVIGAGISKTGSILTNHCSVYIPNQPTEYAHYDKIHPFFPEQSKFSHGEGITLFKHEGWIVAPSICYDLRFPETYREAALKGANLLTVQAAWPQSRLMHFETLLQARAIENQSYVIAVNACGLDANNVTYAGNSCVIDAEGKFVAKAGDKETVLKAELDFSAMNAYRDRFPALKDARSC